MIHIGWTDSRFGQYVQCNVRDHTWSIVVVRSLITTLLSLWTIVKLEQEWTDVVEGSMGTRGGVKRLFRIRNEMHNGGCVFSQARVAGVQSDTDDSYSANQG